MLANGTYNESIDINQSLTLDSLGTAILNSITANANISLEGTFQTSGAQTYNNPVTLAGNTSLWTIGGANITFASTIDGATAGADSLSISTTGQAQLLGAIGTTPLSSFGLTTGGTLNLDQNITAAGAINITVTSGTSAPVSQDLIGSAHGAGHDDLTKRQCHFAIRQRHHTQHPLHDQRPARRSHRLR